MLNLLAWIGTDCKDALCETQLTLLVILAAAAPFIVAVTMLGTLGYFVQTYVKARKRGDLRTSKKYKKLLLIAVAIIAALFFTSLSGTYLYERNKDQLVLHTSFSIYAPANHPLDIEYLRQKSDLTVPHVKSRLKTPLGDIKVIQGAIDDEVKDMYRPPDRCDIDEIYKYLSVWGKNDKQPAKIPCQQVTTGSNWTLLKTAALSDFGNRAPFAASIDNTIVVFHAFKSSAGEFTGTPAQAEEYILTFLKEAVVVDPKTLL
jgi:hypothetical protein